MKKSIRTPTARQLPSGNWNCRMRIGGRDISLTRETEAAAIAEVMAIANGIIAEVKQPKQKLLGAIIDDYIASREGTKSPATIRGYDGIRRNQFQGLMRLAPAQITGAMWQAAIRDELKLRSEKTIQNAWGLIGAALRYARLPVPEVSLPMIPTNEHPYLMPEQIPAFLEAIRNEPVELPALLALHSLRRSEIMALTWKDIDIERQEIRVCGAGVYDKNNQFVQKKQNKNRSSARVVPILIPRLDELLQVRRGEPTEHIVAFKPDTIFRQINRACRSAGLLEVGCHGLRHSFASLAYMLGVSEAATMRIGGWRDIQTMRKIYTHLSAHYLGEQADKMRHFYAVQRTGEQEKIDNADDNAAPYTLDLQWG